MQITSILLWEAGSPRAPKNAVVDLPSEKRNLKVDFGPDLKVDFGASTSDRDRDGGGGWMGTRISLHVLRRVFGVLVV